MKTVFNPHHFALSVRSIEKSADFYSVFGFRLALRWTAEDASLIIAHLSRDDGFILELFQYESNRDLPASEPKIGNDLERVGVKHLAFRVKDLSSAATEFSEMNLGEMTDIQHGRTEIDYFFIADPDGNWVEVAQDGRSLDPAHPVEINER